MVFIKKTQRFNGYWRQVPYFQSTLLKAIVGEHPINAGKISYCGKLSYYDQEPWLLSRTLRQNILLDESRDQNRYSAVVAASCLNQVCQSSVQNIVS